jgi:hypothetical protein
LLKQFLLDPIFGATWRLQNPSAGLVLERFAQESHGAIEMM